VPAGALQELTGVQGELRRLLPRASIAWTKPESMHLTMRFLGNVHAYSIGDIAARLRAGLSGFPKMDLICERLGCFPDLRNPRVVWAGVHSPTDELDRLHRCIDAAVESFAEKPAEQRFVGHITLGRPKQINRRDSDQLAAFVNQSSNRSFGHWVTPEVLLLQSKLESGGPKYFELARIHLV